MYQVLPIYREGDRGLGELVKEIMKGFFVWKRILGTNESEKRTTTGITTINSFVLIHPLMTLILS